MNIRICLTIIFVALLFNAKAQTSTLFIDSLKTIPVSPSEQDSVTLIAYIVTPNSASLYDQTKYFTDSIVRITDCYINGTDASVHNFNDTIKLGKFLAGNYIIWYILKQPSVYQVDSPQDCRTQPYYDSAYHDFTVRSVAAIREIPNQHNFSIYPNPATNFITLAVGEDFMGSTFVLSDVTGRNIKRIKITNSTSQIPIDDLPEGLYFIQTKNSDGKLMTKKIVKE